MCHTLRARLRTCRNGTGSPGHGSPGHWVSDFGRVGSGHGSVCQTRCMTRFWVLTCAFIVALFLQSNTISANIGFGFGSVPVTALLFYSFQSVPVIFTYLRVDCPCDVTAFLDLTSFRHDRVRSGRVGSRVKNPDPVPSLV